MFNKIIDENFEVFQDFYLSLHISHCGFLRLLLQLKSPSTLSAAGLFRILVFHINHVRFISWPLRESRDKQEEKLQLRCEVS